MSLSRTEKQQLKILLCQTQGNWLFLGDIFGSALPFFPADCQQIGYKRNSPQSEGLLSEDTLRWKQIQMTKIQNLCLRRQVFKTFRSLGHFHPAPIRREPKLNRCWVSFDIVSDFRSPFSRGRVYPCEGSGALDFTWKSAIYSTKWRCSITLVEQTIRPLAEQADKANLHIAIRRNFLLPRV